MVLVWLLGVVWSRLGRALCLSRPRERGHVSKHGARVVALSTRLRAGRWVTSIFFLLLADDEKLVLGELLLETAVAGLEH
jgi:hypothetical protein